MPVVESGCVSYLGALRYIKQDFCANAPSHPVQVVPLIAITSLEVGRPPIWMDHLMSSWHHWTPRMVLKMKRTTVARWFTARYVSVNILKNKIFRFY